MTTTDTPTQYQQEYDRLLETGLRRFAEQAEADYTSTMETVVDRLADEEPSYVLRWNGEAMLAAEVARKLGRYVLDVLENGRTPTEAAEAGNSWLQSVVNEGVTSSWSGYMSNEVARTKAKAALDLQGHGSWVSAVTGAQYQAMFSVVSNQPVVLAETAVNGLRAKYDRARSPESRQKLNAQLTVAKDRLEAAQAAYRLFAEQAGVPSEMIR
jgi:hypothetical protein